MKEIGKLIELLNEYDSGWSYDDYYGPFQYGQDSDAYHLCKYQLVSKEYGFIKWLVENDKIDFELDSIIHKHKGIDFNTGKGIAVEKLCNKYESLLMLLSISDTPIEDLCEYLKDDNEELRIEREFQKGNTIFPM